MLIERHWRDGKLEVEGTGNGEIKVIGSEMRPSIRYLVFGPITKSASFWVEIGLIAAAAQSLGAIWHHISKSIDATQRATEILVFLAFAFFLGLYIYFVDLAKLKTQARAETDLAKLRILCK